MEENKPIEQPQETQTEVTEKTPREIFYERVRASRPDGKYDEDEEEYFRGAQSMMDEMEDGNKRYKSVSAMFEKLQGRNPDEVSAILDALDGMPLMAAVRKNLPEEAINLKEGDEGYDDMLKAQEEKTKHFQESMKHAQMLKENGDASDALLKEFAAEQGMSEEEAKEFTDMVVADYNDFIQGKVSKDVLNRYKRARDYDKDIASAREQGLVDGRNEKIEIEKKRMQGSGLPSAAAGGDVNDETKTEKNNQTADFLSKIRRG